MERKTIPPWSTERRLLDLCNSVFTLVFTVEMAMKAVGCSLFIGENCYFSDNWNRLDGSLVMVGLLDSIGKNEVTKGIKKKSISMCSVSYCWKAEQNFRDAPAVETVQSLQTTESNPQNARWSQTLLRSLPSSPSEGLKLVVQSLLISLKPIGNIVLICCTFFLIFGILGVQVLFKKFFRSIELTEIFSCLKECSTIVMVRIY